MADNDVGDDLPFDDVCVNHHSTIGSLSAIAFRTVGVIGSQPALGSIMIHHGVHISRADAKKQSRSAKCHEIRVVMPIRLSDDAYLESGCFQAPRDDGHAKGGMVYIGISADEDDVAGRPSTGIQIAFINWEKRHIIPNNVLETTVMSSLECHSDRRELLNHYYLSLCSIQC